MCKSHYAFIDKRFGVDNHELLSEFVQGITMIFRGDDRLLKVPLNRLPESSRQGVKITRNIMKRLLPLINEAPKAQRQLYLFRAHHFDTLPKAGSVIEFRMPMSTSMTHTLTVEWIVARLHEPSYKPVLMVVRVPAGTGGLLCIGCPTPHGCSIEHQRTFRVGPQTGWAYQALMQNQLQNQSEVILAPGKVRVTGTTEFRMTDIHNLDRYGLGWYTSVQTKKVNQSKVITCIFVDLLAANEHSPPRR